uniref:Lipoxygenase domain-containing protein n=1 Tax=Neogobius melanostomus TaxID=47308 RepID=A0A8C6WH08_9GOBI
LLLWCSRPAPVSLGKLVLIELEKMKRPLLPLLPWFVEKVEVDSLENDTFKFPIYHWIVDEEIHRFRECTALTVVQDDHPLAKYTRQMELQERRKQYCLSGILVTKCVAFSEYVQKHWREDAFFGYQFLNGVNPMMIQRCSKLPSNFPVTENMLYLHGARSLEEEMQKGNIFLCDYKTLDGVKANVIHDEQQYLVAPLVLLHQTPDGKLLKPIAIQQTPGEDNPIFLPSDSEYDWLLAKTFVRSAYFNEHELNIHLLCTHLLAEVFTVALLRNVPMVHPLYKLLIPHTRYTLQINLLAREKLISEDGFFTLFTSSGGAGMVNILQNSLSCLKYSSLCLPDDITERGVQSVPNYYYRDDGLRLWGIIHRFVNGVLRFYYKNDTEVEDDSELQNWIKDIYEEGFLSNQNTGIPQHFHSLSELVKFTTMVIFTCSAQHAAVNSGQFDYGGWMPNAPTTLQLPPPTKKETATEETLLNTLPDISTTVHGMAVLYLLSKQSTDFVALGQYPNERFCEEVPCRLIKYFQSELEDMHVHVKQRNKDLPLPYLYLDPKQMENSVSL